MNYRYVAVAVTVGALMVLTPMSAGAQSETTTAPRTPWGEPDLQGVWDFRTLTPLQRPSDRADQDLLTAEEAAEIEANAVQRAIDAAGAAALQVTVTDAHLGTPPRSSRALRCSFREVTAV